MSDTLDRPALVATGPFWNVYFGLPNAPVKPVPKIADEREARRFACRCEGEDQPHYTVSADTAHEARQIGIDRAFQRTNDLVTVRGAVFMIETAGVPVMVRTSHRHMPGDHQ